MAEKSPRLQTSRLQLRHPELRDAGRLAELANHPEIASTTFIIESPCTVQHINSWLVRHECMMEAGEGMVWAIVYDGEIIGVVTFDIDRENNAGTLAYWIGRDYWRQGFATEASKAVLYLAFECLGIIRVMAICMTRNPASMRVLEKLGMKHEGLLRSYQKKDGNYEDCHVYAMLIEDWRNR